MLLKKRYYEMTEKDYIIGVDCSTTAAKAIVWDKKGNSVVEAREDIPLLTPRPDWVEQRAEDWWDATAKSIRSAVQQVNPQRIAAIGITHQRESFVPINRDLKPVRNGILWTDTRSTAQVEQLRRKWGKKIHKITGRFPNLYASNVKIMWMKENEPTLFQSVYKYLDVAAYLNLKLTGRFITTWPSACPMGIVDISKLCWSREILDLLDVKEEQFCELTAPGSIVGTLNKETASLLGLPGGVPVVGGGGDGQCAALGAGVIEEGRASLNLGTAVVSELYSQEYTPGEPYRSMCGCVPKTYINETLIAAGVFTINWFIEEFGDDIQKVSKENNIVPEQIFEIMASEIGPGKPRLLMIPYWKAASAPFWDPFAKGVVIGWSENIKKAHFYRSILEGIIFEQKYLYDETQKYLNEKIEEIVLLGGGARSPLWRQIVADIVGIPVLIPTTLESTCLGAAMLAASAVGIYPGVSEASKNMSAVKDKYTPVKKNRDFYLKIYEEVYRSLFRTIQDLVDKFTKITLFENHIDY